MAWQFTVFTSWKKWMCCLHAIKNLNKLHVVCIDPWVLNCISNQMSWLYRKTPAQQYAHMWKEWRKDAWGQKADLGGPIASSKCGTVQLSSMMWPEMSRDTRLLRLCTTVVRIFLVILNLDERWFSREMSKCLWEHSFAKGLEQGLQPFFLRELLWQTAEALRTEILNNSVKYYFITECFVAYEICLCQKIG